MCPPLFLSEIACGAGRATTMARFAQNFLQIESDQSVVLDNENASVAQDRSHHSPPPAPARAPDQADGPSDNLPGTVVSSDNVD